MAEAIQTVYRGHVITFCENGETWEAQVSGGRRFEKTSLAEVKKRIDDFEKQESQFKNLTVISTGRSGWREYPFGAKLVITSVQADGDVWINRDGKREKVSKGSRDILCNDTPENEAKVREYQDLAQQVAGLEARMKEVAGSMTRVFND